MKDGRTHLAHKAEHAVDLASGAIMAVTLQAADQGDTATVRETLKEAQTNAKLVNERGVEELVADKGYHSGATLVAMHGESVKTYIPEPDRGRRRWQGRETEQRRVYANRRRVGGRRGKQLQKLRSELTERSFAHMYDSSSTPLFRKFHSISDLELQKCCSDTLFLRRRIPGVKFSMSASRVAALRRRLGKPCPPLPESGREKRSSCR